jgi:hypothetical protein
LINWLHSQRSARATEPSRPRHCSTCMNRNFHAMGRAKPGGERLECRRAACGAHVATTLRRKGLGCGGSDTLRRSGDQYALVAKIEIPMLFNQASVGRIFVGTGITRNYERRTRRRTQCGAPRDRGTPSGVVAPPRGRCLEIRWGGSGRAASALLHVRRPPDVNRKAARVRDTPALFR